MFGQLGEDLLHRPAEIDPDHRAAERRFVDDGQEARRIVLQLLEEHAVAGDLSQRLPVGRAGDAEPDRQRGAVARQPDHPHVVAEIFAAELRADAELLGQLMDLRLELEIAERAASAEPLGRQRVEIAGRGELDGLQRSVPRSGRR